MSADLFAAFEDSSKPAPPKGQKGQPANTSKQVSSFTPDPFSFNNPKKTSAQIGQHTNPITQRWSTDTSLRSGQLRNTQQPSGVNGWTGAPFQSTQSKLQDAEDDDDGWGDFEVAPNVNQPPNTSVIATAPSRTVVKERQSPPRRTRVVRASTIDLMSNNLLDLNNPSALRNDARVPSWMQGQPKKVKAPTPQVAFSKPPKKIPNVNSNVLFDADDFHGEQQDGGDDDDDFGEFETVASPAQPEPDLLSTNFYSPPTTTKMRPSQMLSGLNLTSQTSYPQAPRSPSFHERNPFPGLAVAPPSAPEKKPTNESKPSPVTAWPSLDANKSAGSNGLNEDWGSFDDLPTGKTESNMDTNKADSNWDWDSEEPVQQKPVKTKAPVVAPEPKDSSWDWDPVDADTEQQTEQVKDELPPTNVPPPSILLSIFPQLFDEANTSLYKPVSGQSFSVKNRILSDPKTVEFLKGYLALATVVARVIAGRKLRWHRDKFLSQRMTISAAGSKGMKLAGIDKAQTAREDREAADVVAHWKEYIGRLRSAVATANSSIKNSTEQLKIPEISETMPIQTEKLVPTAPKACIVCGLKRNERIAKVDYEVEDSFGEWWIDHWGHLECKRFWLHHEGALRQR
ncbi:uncharacterized protein GGS22DRAFT_156596 [Annulohypoxylon maeteangense]|uniref:uncharacterized protein n=1 Tax=Annulohypoxylon maeteangense TaxID=1927788 RepID=UPI0020072635|nr:uncharacterized protein GGS22DRAFT_156596 [Annulohypoxylon maeteangense]KAI0887272.1 hypothetical protein GGS22DRAFT_156596 [Annulohypoxylon maeteangense]